MGAGPIPWPSSDTGCDSTDCGWDTAPVYGPPQASTVPSAPVPTGNNVSVWQTLAGIIPGTLGTILGYKLQQNQINHGQYPSVGLANGFFPTGQPVTGAIAGGSWLWIIVGVVILLLLFKR